MNTYDAGDLVQVRAAFSGPNQQGVVVPTDPTAVTAHVRAPDGTVVAYAGVTAPTREGVGLYRLDLTPTLAGTYWYSFEGSGAVQEVQESAFAVRPRQATTAAGAPLCGLGDLENLIQVQVPAGDRDAALAAIAAASAAIRTYTGQALTFVADDAIVLNGRGYGLWLPELPVSAVSAVSVGGTALDPAGWAVDPGGKLVRLDAGGASGYPWPGRWAWGYRNVAVTYSHGYAELPADLVNVCARLASRQYLGGKRSALVGPHARESDYSTVYQGEERSDSMGAYGPTSAPILTGHEKMILDAYKPIRLGYG